MFEAKIVFIDPLHVSDFIISFIKNLKESGVINSNGGILLGFDYASYNVSINHIPGHDSPDKKAALKVMDMIYTVFQDQSAIYKVRYSKDDLKWNPGTVERNFTLYGNEGGVTSMGIILSGINQ